MKTSTVFWSLIVNTILFFIIRYCYNNIEGGGILLFFFLVALLVHLFFGLIYILDTSDVPSEYKLSLDLKQEEARNILLEWTFFLPSLITVIMYMGFLSIKNSIATGIKKTFNQINKLLDS